MGAERTDQNTERQKFTGDLSFDWQQTVNKVPWTKWIHVHSNCYCLVGDLRSSRQTSWQYIRVQTTCPKKNIVQTSRHVFSPLSEYYQGNPFYTQGYGKRRKWWIKSYKWWTNGLKWWLRRRSTVTCVFSPRPICSKVKQNGFVPRKKRNARNSNFFTFLMECVYWVFDHCQVSTDVESHILLYVLCMIAIIISRTSKVIAHGFI